MGSRQKAVIAAVGVAIVLGVGVPVIASGAGSSERVAVTKQAPPVAKPGAGNVQRMAPINPTMGRACDLTCTQRALVSLIKKHNKLVKEFNKLKGSYYNCERIRDVTQYGGYDYLGSPGATTALDFTQAGGTPSARMLTWVC